MWKKKTGKESQYLVSHLELSSDPPIGSDRESGLDMDCVCYFICYCWKNEYHLECVVILLM